MSTSDVFEKLQLSSDEAERLKKAFQNEEFRKLFKEYAEEISDPENRKRYEEEIQMMEAERGMDCKFVNPDPGYVIKVIVDGEKKAFINIAKNELVGAPSSSMATKPDGTKGMQWSIPHSFAPPRYDLDKKGQKCSVYDVIFHPDTYRMAESNRQFKKMVEDTAIDGIEKQFAVNIDKNNLKFPKLKYKGTPTATVIRSRSGNKAVEKDPDDITSKLKYPYDDLTTEEKSKKALEDAERRIQKNKTIEEKTTKYKESKISGNATVPKYTITHRSELDIQQFTNAPDTGTYNRPKELVISIDLPLITSASLVDLDIFERKLVLKTEKPAKYMLELNLSHAVDEENGNAKFDKSKQRLTVTLPVQPIKSPELPNVHGVNETTDAAAEENLSLDDSAIASMDEELCTDNQPLIQVISSKENEMQNNDKETADDQLKEASPKDIWMPEAPQPRTLSKVRYVLPQYDYNQNDCSVILILYVKNVNNDTVSRSFPSTDVNQSFQVKFASVGAGGFPIHYSVLVQFPESNKFDPYAVNIDISQDNVVIVIPKQKESYGVWNSFYIGKDEASLEEKLFVTDKNLTAKFQDLEADIMPSTEHDNATHDFEVTDMNDNKLTIQVRYKDSSSSESCSPRQKNLLEYGDDIKVIHEKHTPKLHGILKQRSRTTSESSDEVYTAMNNYSRENSVGQESVISESDEMNESGRKKSVSFSEDIDKTLFKSGHSVTALHNTLKNKKKRMRKKEQKKEIKIQRRRRRSSGSMSSDADDTNSLTDETGSTSEDVANECDFEMNNEVQKNTEDHMTNAASSEVFMEDRNNLPNGSKDENVIATEAHQPLETSEKYEKAGKIQQEDTRSNGVIADEELSKSGANSAEVAQESNSIQVSEEAREEGITSQAGTTESVNSSLVGRKEKKKSKRKNRKSHSEKKGATKKYAHQPPENNGDTSEGSEVSQNENVATADDKTNESEENLTNSEARDSGKKPTVKIVKNEDDSDDEGGRVETDGDIHHQNRTKLPDADAPETMLSWEENATTVDLSEHKTKCAFSFANSLMFDLDDD